MSVLRFINRGTAGSDIPFPSRMIKMSLTHLRNHSRLQKALGRLLKDSMTDGDYKVEIIRVTRVTRVTKVTGLFMALFISGSDYQV